jgi:hypothetical protein
MITMKKRTGILILTINLLLLGAFAPSHAEKEPVIKGFQMITRGTKVRVITTKGTESFKIEKKASFSLSGIDIEMSVDGRSIADFVLPKKLPVLSSGTKIDGVISRLNFYRDEKPIISFDNGIIWTNMSAKVRFFAKNDKHYVKILRKRFTRKRNLGVRIFEIKE